MISSPDKLSVGDYFNIICSDPIDLRPLGKGTDKQRMAAWMKIRGEDEKLSPSKSNTQDLHEEYNYLVDRNVRLITCYSVLIIENFNAKRKKDTTDEVTHQNIKTYMSEMGVVGKRSQCLLRLEDLIKGTRKQIEEIVNTYENRPKITKDECYLELATISKFNPSVNERSSLSFYRGAQKGYINHINSLKHGNPDN